MDDINARIRECLDEDQRSQADLARLIGVSRATLNDWKRGRTKNLKMENLFAIADAFGVSARWLATGSGPKRDPLQTPIIRDVAECLATASPATQESFARMAHNIADEIARYRKAS